jgi:hypothetical protein
MTVVGAARVSARLAAAFRAATNATLPYESTGEPYQIAGGDTTRIWRNALNGIRMETMSNKKAAIDIDTRTLEGLLDDLRDLHARLEVELRELDKSPRLSEDYLDHLSEIYTLMTWAKGLAPDLQTEMDRLDDELPDE